LKKLFVLLLALALMFSSFTVVSAEAANELTVWCWDPAFNIYAMNEAAKVYQEAHPDFKLNVVETPWDDVQTKITTIGMSGDLSGLPDIFLCQDNAFQKNVINLPGVFADITSGGVDFAQFPSAKVAYSVVDGENYGVPFDNGATVQAMRTDILAQAGYTIADLTDITWDRFIEIGKDVKAKTGLPMISGQAGSPDMIMIMLQSCGSSLFKADGTLNIKDNAALKKVIGYYAEMVKEGVFVEANGWDGYIASFVNNNCTGTINGCWILGSIQTAKDQVGKWALTNIPKVDIEGGTNYSNNGGSSWAVSASSKNYQLANDFLATTFGGSVKFYETILPSSGALATYLPAGQSEVYGQPSEFFGGQKVFADITAYAAKVPSNATGVYYYEARDAVGTAITQVLGGADVDAALAEADATVAFQMGA
jgi:lactose/L-arabinose transport system substrate-binding protein